MFAARPLMEDSVTVTFLAVVSPPSKNVEAASHTGIVARSSGLVDDHVGRDVGQGRGPEEGLLPSLTTSYWVGLTTVTGDELPST